MARIIPPGEGRSWMFRWPRQEGIHITDKYGGMIRDFWIKMVQGAGILGILLVGLALGGFTLWSLPPTLWWVILSVLYFVVAFGLPVAATHLMLHRSELWKWAIGMVAFMSLWAIIAWRIYYEFIWEPLDAWTVGFFDFKLPELNLLALLGGSLLVMGFTTWVLIGKEPLTLIFLALGSGLIAVWILMAEYRQPGLKFYLILIAVDIAYGWVAKHTVEVLRHEQADTYEPYGSQTDAEEEEEESTAELRFIKEGGRLGLSPLKDPGPMIRVDGPKGEEWLMSEANLVHFVRQLPIVGLSKESWMKRKMPAGLWFLNKQGKAYVKNKEMTRWEHWAPYKHFLLHYGVLTAPNGRKVERMFLDAADQPDAESILEYLKLNGYADVEDAKGKG